MFCFVAAEVVDEGNAGIVADADIDSGSEGDCERIKGHSDGLKLSDDDVSDDEGIDENQNLPPLWSLDDVVDESNAEVNATSNDIYSDDDDNTNVDEDDVVGEGVHPLPSSTTSPISLAVSNVMLNEQLSNHIVGYVGFETGVVGDPEKAFSRVRHSMIKSVEGNRYNIVSRLLL